MQSKEIEESDEYFDSITPLESSRNTGGEKENIRKTHRRRKHVFVSQVDLKPFATGSKPDTSELSITQECALNENAYRTEAPPSKETIGN